MLFDHSMLLSLGADYINSPLRSIGLCCYPVFILAFSSTGKRDFRTAKKLLLWGVISQAGFSLVLAQDRLNILFAFAAALLPFPFMLAVAVLLGNYIDGGLLGIVATWFAIEKSKPLEDLPFPFHVPKAQYFVMIYAFHFWLLYAAAKLLNSA
jgi:hypothetical protein